MHFDCLREKMLGNKSFTLYTYLIPTKIYYAYEYDVLLSIYSVFDFPTRNLILCDMIYGELIFCDITFWSYTNITGVISLTTAFKVSLLDLIMELSCTYFLNLYIHFVVKKD